MYSILVFLGIVAYFICFFVIFKKEKFSRPSTNRLLFASLLGIASCGLFALIVNSIFHSIEKGMITVGGITWLGGVLGALPSMILLIHFFVPKAKGNALNTLSLMMPGMVIGHAFGRFGCFFAGCCYGRPTDSFLGVTYPKGSHAAHEFPLDPSDMINTVSQKVLPTQLFEAFFEILLFLFMVLTYKKMKRFFVETYCFAYAPFRFAMEFLRGDDRGSTGFALSPSQLMSIVLFIIGILLVLYRNGFLFGNLRRAAALWRKEADNYVEPAPGTSAIPTFRPKAQSSADDLRSLKQLLDEGILTQEEFDAKKSEILKRM